MKNNTVSLSVLTILLSTSVSAGTMGASQISFVKPFVGIEGGYTWNQMQGFDFNFIDSFRLHSIEDNNGWTGRLSAGLLHELNADFSVTGELGWGYYGKTRFNSTISGVNAANPLSNLNISNSINGFDVLGGITYTQPSYDLFFKAGALVQNSQWELNTRLPSLAPNAAGNLNFQSNQTQALPEVKVGGAYHLTEQLSLTGAWMHAFGAHQKANTTFNMSTLQTFANFNTQNPSLDSLMVGLNYRFG